MDAVRRIPISEALNRPGSLRFWPRWGSISMIVRLDGGEGLRFGRGFGLGNPPRKPDSGGFIEAKAAWILLICHTIGPPQVAPSRCDRPGLDRKKMPTLSCRLLPTRLRMRLALLFLVGASVASAAVADERDKFQEPPGSYYAMTLGRSGFDLVVASYWSLGPLLRSQTVVAGHLIVTLVDKKYYYTYDALTRKGYRIGRSKKAIAQDAGRLRPFALDYVDLIAEGGEKVREETLNGIRVDVYRATDEKGRRTLWVTQNSLKFPVKLESYNRKSARTSVLDWVQWIPAIDLEKEFFEPPSDMDLRRFDDYGEFREALKEGTVEPSPPLFQYLLHTWE